MQVKKLSSKGIKSVFVCLGTVGAVCVSHALRDVECRRSMKLNSKIIMSEFVCLGTVGLVCVLHALSLLFLREFAGNIGKTTNHSQRTKKIVCVWVTSGVRSSSAGDTPNRPCYNAQMKYCAKSRPEKHRDSGMTYLSFHHDPAYAQNTFCKLMLGLFSRTFHHVLNQPLLR